MAKGHLGVDRVVQPKSKKETSVNLCGWGFILVEIVIPLSENPSFPKASSEGGRGSQSVPRISTMVPSNWVKWGKTGHPGPALLPVSDGGAGWQGQGRPHGPWAGLRMEPMEDKVRLEVVREWVGSFSGYQRTEGAEGQVHHLEWVVSERWRACLHVHVWWCACWCV